MAIIIYITFDVTAGHIQRFESVAKEGMRKTQAEPGCLKYVFARDLGKENRYHLCEYWNSAGELTAHLKQPHVANFNALMPDVMTVSDFRAESGDLKPFDVMALLKA